MGVVVNGHKVVIPYGAGIEHLTHVDSNKPAAELGKVL